MCGIAGFIVPARSVDVDSALRQMAGAIAHRGPDDEGFFRMATREGDREIGLAHRRLSIIDLTTGRQPLGNETGSVQIVFNGEIYNFEALRDELTRCGHSFRTSSDTETIVHAYEEWGTDCVDRFRGMFAFAIWDSDRSRLFLARDRFGKKPLFLYERDGRLLFGSEVKALLAFPGVTPEVDRSSIVDYLAYRYVPGPATLFRNIRKLMPGCVAVWERGRLIERRYYRPPDHQALSAASEPEGDIVGEFIAQLDEAVRVRMISDVPFGAFLSGGIDSSAVVALMSRHSGRPIKTFSVGFSEAAYSELCYARSIAEQFGTDHHELTVSEGHLIEYLPTLIRFRDAPVAEPSDIPIYLLSCEARRTVKMVLTGEGSDEFLGGYPKHVYEGFAEAYQRVPSLLRRKLLEPLVAALPYRFHRAKTAIAALGLDQRTERMIRWFGALSPRQRLDLLSVEHVGYGSSRGVQFEVEPGNSALRSILYFDQTSWLPDNLLERGDRMTMAASIEARMPFMDHHLAGFVSRLPDRWRVDGRITKNILRQAMTRLLPPHILERPKVGFRVPVNKWFRGPMREYLHDHLLGAASRTRDYYRHRELARIFAEHVRGQQNHEKLLWTLLTLEIWHREYY
ncbi:MAG TPA: asparagine synthase (glutamine-hydrolyzing) [Thermodesulfobacteriota bacterium]|nr:asparagine synthase (glutamine-hydrolyzing) [Thermodesulfobacteriota bacterium]